MRTRPWPVKLITLALFAVPLVEYFIILYAQNKWHIQLTRDLMITMFGLGLGSVVTGIGVWRVRLWGYYVMIAFGLIIIGEDISQIIARTGSFNLWDLSDILFVVSAIAVLSFKRIRAPYFNPNLRWWEREARHPANLTANFNVKDQSLQSPILDISASGCFADLKGDIKAGDLLKMKLQFEAYAIETPAKVVRVSQNPVGVGIMFFDTTRDNRVTLKKLISYLTKSTQQAA